MALSAQICGPRFDPPTSGDEEPVPVFRQLAGGDPARGDDVRARSAIATEGGGPVVRARIDIRHEPVRLWESRFGPMFAAEIRRKRVHHMREFTDRRWHLDEVYVTRRAA